VYIYNDGIAVAGTHETVVVPWADCQGKSWEEDNGGEEAHFVDFGV
jgi:hypothetical protein